MGLNGCIIGGHDPTPYGTPEILDVIASTDKFKGVWRAQPEFNPFREETREPPIHGTDVTLETIHWFLANHLDVRVGSRLRGYGSTWPHDVQDRQVGVFPIRPGTGANGLPMARPACRFQLARLR